MDKSARAASINSDQNVHTVAASDLSLPLFPLKEWSNQGLHPQTTFLIEINSMNLDQNSHIWVHNVCNSGYQSSKADEQTTIVVKLK